MNEQELNKQFEDCISCNCFPVGFPGIGWHQLTNDDRKEFIDAMQSAYQLGLDAQKERVAELETALKAVIVGNGKPDLYLDNIIRNYLGGN